MRCDCQWKSQVKVISKLDQALHLDNEWGLLISFIGHENMLSPIDLHQNVTRTIWGYSSKLKIFDFCQSYQLQKEITVKTDGHMKWVLYVSVEGYQISM